MENEAQNNAVSDIIHNQYIDRSKKAEILEQLHLLKGSDKFAFEVCCISRKISKVHCYEGMLWYFSDVKSLKTTNHTMGGDSFSKYFESQNTFNMPFFEVYLSFVKICDENYYIEHNTALTDGEVDKIMELVNRYDKMYKALKSEIDSLLSNISNKDD